MPILKRILAALLFVLVVGSIWQLTRTPKSEATWLPEQSRVARAAIEEGVVTIQNVRDWTYTSEGPASEDWQTQTIRTEDIAGAWFYIEPFASWKAVGHTFLAFELADGSTIAFSVEARREVGEEYSAARGLLRTYELTYQWGTERDFVTRRLVYLNHPLRLYPLTLSPEASRALFVSLATETNTLADTPRFYNTLGANCTNVLAHIVNQHYLGTLPYDLSWNLTGYADTYLMKEGLIEVTESVDATMKAYDLTPHRDFVAKEYATTSPAFSRFIRSMLP